MNSERIALGVNAPTGGATFAAIAAQHLATEFAITRARRRNVQDRHRDKDARGDLLRIPLTRDREAVFGELDAAIVWARMHERFELREHGIEVTSSRPYSNRSSSWPRTGE